jgi:hypothetical protein
MSDHDDPLEISRDVRLDGDRALRVSVGMFGFTITDNQVWVSIPDRFGNPAAYNFSHADWDRIMELIPGVRAECM